MRKLRSYIGFAILTLLVLAYSNCSSSHFAFIGAHEAAPKASANAEGNGQGYDGKPDGTFDLVLKNFSCEGRPAPYATISFVKGIAKIVVNAKDKCASLIEGLDPKRLIMSPTNRKVLAYDNDIYRLRENSNAPDLKLTVPTWCHADADSTHSEYDVIVQELSNGEISAQVSTSSQIATYLNLSSVESSGHKQFTSDLFDLNVDITSSVQSSWGDYAGAFSSKLAELMIGTSKTLCRLARTPTIGTQAETWTTASNVNAPANRAFSVSAFIDGKALIWGGLNDIGASGLGSGSIFDTRSNTWVPMSGTNAPSSRYFHKAVATGTGLLVWGGYDNPSVFSPNSSGTGGIYNLATDTWSSITTTGAPIERSEHTVVWTGAQALVWGGRRVDSTRLNDGAFYDPKDDTWKKISEIKAPQARNNHCAVWTGNKMLIWGGEASPIDREAPYPLSDGAIYDAVTDSWSAMNTANAPSARAFHSCIWTGDKLLVLGGRAGWTGAPALDAAAYDLKSDKWSAISPPNAPEGLSATTWDGQKTISLSNGRLYIYDPRIDFWSVSEPFNPDAIGTFLYSEALWTGNRVLYLSGDLYSTTTAPTFYTPHE